MHITVLSLLTVPLTVGASVEGPLGVSLTPLGASPTRYVTHRPLCPLAPRTVNYNTATSQQQCDNNNSNNMSSSAKGARKKNTQEEFGYVAQASDNSQAMHIELFLSLYTWCY